VLRKLGQGGMGAVYEAVHEEIGRRAAIKILLPEFALDQQNILRFFNEARAVNIIQHPGLVGVFESGRLDDGAAYIVMEYLEGELLSGRLQRAGRLPGKTALTLVRQIASALAAAHSKRIVHRDLKPDNIMLVPDPETPDGERVKIFDFGIAKLRTDSLGPSRNVGLEFRTATGMIMGTPTHMAPEQCRGASDVTGKADVYALGVILYQSLIGHPPFVASSAGELLSMHLRDQPTPLRKLDKTISEDIADLVQRMLAKEPNDRPEMSEVVAALEELGAYRSRHGASDAHIVVTKSDKGRQKAPVQTMPPVVGQTFGTVTQRRFVFAIVVSALMVLVAAVILFGDLPGRRAAHEDGRADGAQVRWSIDSEPSGAQVVRDDNGQVLGETPYHADRPRGSGEVKLRVRAQGYGEQTVIADAASNLTTTVYLNKQAPRHEDAERPPPVAALPTGTVEWKIGSRPNGAAVIRVDTGETLGVTPFTKQWPAAPGTLKVILRAPGYVDTLVILDQSSPMDMKYVLRSIKPQRKRQAREDDIPLFDSEEGASSSGAAEPSK
jgi:serine/threonine-protein kinase